MAQKKAQRATRTPDGGVVLQFPWVDYLTPGLVDMLKGTIPVHCRRYDPATKLWRVSHPYAAQAIALLRRAFPDAQVIDASGFGHGAPPPPPRQAMATERHYAALHLLPSAPPELVNSAYRTLVKLHHPDVLPTGERDRATRVAQELNVAIEALRSAGVA
jgi:hypothetical protein